MLAVTLYRSEARVRLGARLSGRPPRRHQRAVAAAFRRGPGAGAARPLMAGRPTPAGGICGSDLAAVSGHASLYLGPLTSYPFVPGHEVVGQRTAATRVVVEPALGCRVRGLDPPCPQCAAGRPGLCDGSRGDRRGRAADRILRRHRWGLGGEAGGPPLAAAPGARRALGRGGGADRALRVRSPRRAAGRVASRTTGASSTERARSGLLTLAAVRSSPLPGRCWRWPSTRSRKSSHARSAPTSVISPAEVLQRVRFHTGAVRLEGMAGGRSLLLGGRRRHVRVHRDARPA